VIEHYASVKTPNCRWDYPNYPDCEIRFTRPVPDEQIAFQPDWHDYAARAAWRKFQVTQLKLGQPAPDIVGNDVQGKPAKLSDDRGRVVVLTVGYSFGEGDAAVKKCIELRKKHGNAPLAMVSVVEERPDEPYYAYNNAAGAGITWKVIADPHGVLCAHWCQETFPEVYVIDAAGILRFHGISGPYSEDFTPLVEDLLKEAESTKKP
jgi:peroxiredoxin